MPAKQEAIHSFEEVFRRNYQRLCQRVSRITNDSEAAEDIVQDVFISLWNSDPDLIQTPEAYLYRACINKALNYVSGTKRKALLGQEHYKTQPEISRSPAQDLEQRELEQQVQQALNMLPPMCRKVFLLSRYEEMTHKEIAEFLEISPNTVDNHIKKALIILRKALLTLLVISTQIYFTFFL